MVETNLILKFIWGPFSAICTRLGNWSIFNLGLRLHWGQEQKWINLMLMSKNNRFCLFTLHLSHVKNGVWLRKRGISTYDYFITEIIKFMHQSSPAAPNPPPPIPWPHPHELALFLPWMANSWGVGTLELSNPPGWWQKKRGKYPVLRQHCNIFHWSHSRIAPF